MGDLGAAAKQAQGLHEAQLLAPFPEGSSGGLDEKPLDGSATCAAGAGNLLKRSWVGRIGDERVGDTESARIFRHRDLQGRGLDGAELIEENINEMALPGDAAIE